MSYSLWKAVIIRKRHYKRRNEQRKKKQFFTINYNLVQVTQWMISQTWKIILTINYNLVYSDTMNRFSNLKNNLDDKLQSSIVTTQWYIDFSKLEKYIFQTVPMIGDILEAGG